MEKIYISKNYFGKNTAESKAKIDCEKIISSMGYRNKGLPSTTFQNHKISSVLTILSSIIGRLRMPHDGIVVLQYPKATINEEIRIAKKKHNRVIIIVHDLETLRGFGASHDDKLSWANDADVLIVHTQKMANFIHDILPQKKIIVLGIFDYLCRITTYSINNPTTYKIAFAGNLTKSDFITEISPENFELFLFGLKKDSQRFNQNVTYKGIYSPEDLPKYLNSHFGLVWDGDINGNGLLGNYLKYISPHKLSMYLSAGLPVIIKKDSAVADFVSAKGIGLTIEQLTELDSILPNLSFHEYERMKNNVYKIQKNVCTGDFMQKAIKKAENILI